MVEFKRGQICKTNHTHIKNYIIYVVIDVGSQDIGVECGGTLYRWIKNLMEDDTIISEIFVGEI